MKRIDQTYMATKESSLHFCVLCHWGWSGQELKGGNWKQGQKQRLRCYLAFFQAHIQVTCIHIWSKDPVAACPQWVGPSHITQQSRNCPLNMLTGRFDGKKNLTWDSLFPGGSSWSQVEQNLTNMHHDLKCTGGSLDLYKHDLIVMQISLFLGVCVCV